MRLKTFSSSNISTRTISAFFVMLFLKLPTRKYKLWKSKGRGTVLKKAKLSPDPNKMIKTSIENILAITRSRMTKVNTFSRQNDAG